jgi:predicted nuclease with TOPRIM domain
MSQFINKAKIAELNLNNTELADELSALKEKCQKLNIEVEHLRGGGADETEALKKRLVDYELREFELNEQLSNIAKSMKNGTASEDIVNQLLSTLRATNCSELETAIGQHYSKMGLPRVIIAFLLGALSPLVIWHIVEFTHNGRLPDNLFNSLLNLF